MRGLATVAPLGARTGSRAGRGSGRAGLDGGVLSAELYRSFVSRPRSGAAPAAAGAGLFPGHDVTRPWEVVTIGRGEAGGNAACGRRGGALAAGPGLWERGPAGRPGRGWREGGMWQGVLGAFCPSQGFCGRSSRGAGRTLARTGTGWSRRAGR